MELISSRKLAGIICRTLNCVDGRLVAHGQKVAYIVMKMLEEAGEYDDKMIRDVCLVATMHDVGAYKTEEIDNMVQFETEYIWEHSVYGYLFFKNMTPLSEFAPIILFHHMPYVKLKKLHVSCERFVQMVKLADRIDVYSSIEHKKGLIDYLERGKGIQFSEDVVDLFLRAEKKYSVIDKLGSDDYWDAVLKILDRVPFTREEIDIYLKMLIYTIDFRSKYTVIHTITTTQISIELGRLFRLNERETEELRYGALLHDLGKIGIPVEILEYPGKLSFQAMNVMRTHVQVTEGILGGEIDETVTKIALRHHEKLDGSGYPKGLKGEQLNICERVVATADVVSALSGERSYKKAFSKEQIISILERECNSGQLCSDVTAMMLLHYDEIMDHVAEACRPVLEAYNAMSTQYEKLIQQCKSL